MRRMRVDLLKPDPADLGEAARALERGELVAFPTETLYGIGCDPRQPGAVEALFRLKGRPEGLRLPFVAADVHQAALLVSIEGEQVRRLVERFWPGPLTLVLPLVGAQRLAPHDWGGSLAIRVPGAPLPRALAAAVGVPLPATSLNRSGQRAVSSPDEMPESIRAGLGVLLDGGPLPPSLPSTILDLTGPSPRMIRPGAVRAEALAAVLGSLLPEDRS